MFNIDTHRPNYKIYALPNVSKSDPDLFEFWPKAASVLSKDKRRQTMAAGTLSTELDALNKSMAESSAKGK